MRIVGLAFAGLAVASPAAAVAGAALPRQDVEAALRQIGAETIRGIEADICFPATAEEYEALGKNAILMLRSTSALSTELPLRSAYLMHRGIRIPLHRLAVLDGQSDPVSSRTTQLSFYLLPIHFMKTDAGLLADFSGQRAGFSVMQFSARRGLGADAPAFARLDEYDAPTDPDPAVIARVLAREYPEHFGESTPPSR